jgi:hypothetical protein
MPCPYAATLHPSASWNWYSLHKVRVQVKYGGLSRTI